MSIPLVRNNTKDAINTSIIAIKKNLERINTLLGLVDSSEPDLSGFATKQELEDTVTEINNTIDEVATSLQPVDTVTSGDMHSVTSNAVYSAISDAVLGKMNVIYKKATTDLNILQNLLDFIKANRLEFVPNGQTRKANYLILENYSGGGCHNVLVGSTNANYFSILIISYYHQIVAYNYANGTWSKKLFT